MIKKIFNFLKMLACGIMPAIDGALVATGIVYIIRNICSISSKSGWIAILHFILALIELTLATIILYNLGVTNDNSNKWCKHKKEVAGNIINGSSEENETSDEAADTSSKPVAKKRGPKKKDQSSIGLPELD